MIRLENSEALDPPELREEAQEDLERLADLLRGKGFDVYVAGLDESIHARLEHSAEQIAIDVLNIVLEHGVEVAVGALAEAIRQWARRRRRFRNRDGARATVAIWGPDGDVISTVELPVPEADTDRGS